MHSRGSRCMTVHIIGQKEMFQRSKFRGWGSHSGAWDQGLNVSNMIVRNKKKR